MKSEKQYKIKFENGKLIKTEEYNYKLTPDEDKCFVNDKGHKFIHTKTGKGLQIYVNEEDLSKYQEINL